MLRKVASAALSAIPALAGSLAPLPAAATETEIAQEYVVAFDPAVAPARQVVADAGGKVVDVNPGLRVALVRSAADDFLEVVRAEPAVRGAARNQAIGHSGPGRRGPSGQRAWSAAGPPRPTHPATARSMETDADAGAAGALNGEAGRRSPGFRGPGAARSAAGTTRAWAIGPVSMAAGSASGVGSGELGEVVGLTPWAGSAVPSGSVAVGARRSGASGGPVGSAGPTDWVRFDSTGASSSTGWTPGGSTDAATAVGDEPLESGQWNMGMIGATTDGTHTRLTGAGVDVGIIDTGIDARHPDIALNFDAARSRNFTTDRPEIDGPCEVPSCVDPADVDGGGHGTHVAATVAGARNGFGMTGVAPEARLVNLRAGQDSGYFFLYETADALVAAGDLGLDVVNLSFYVDPWLYNCDSHDDYLVGQVTDQELAQQQLVRTVVVDALEYAHARGVTLVAAAGNESADLAAPQRADGSRTMTNDCLNLPGEGPHVLSVSAVGPSGEKASYSDYGDGVVDVAAPGGWRNDPAGVAGRGSPENMVLSAYPLEVAVADGLANRDGSPRDASGVQWCDPSRRCGFYRYLQGTSMAAPHAVGVAALVVERYGEGSGASGYGLPPDQVAERLAATATDHACPQRGVGAGGDVCTGTPAANGFYGEGIVDAAAVAMPRR